MALIISGRIAPLDRGDPDAVFKGRVFIDDSGSIDQVSRGNGPAPTGFANAPTVDVGDNLVLPGLIDLHNHLGYNTLPLWTEQKQKEAFAHHDSWPRAKSYQSSITFPSKALVAAAPDAVLAYVQLRALVGGTTAIQGWPAANRRYLQVLRNIDGETAGGTDPNLIRTSALTLKTDDLGKVAQAQNKGAGFIYHCAEGQHNSLVEREFTDAYLAGCLGKTFIGVHLSAIRGDEWKKWSKARAGAIAWSPFSNLWLYGQTTDIAAARKQSISICLGSDWGPSGTKNVQGELKVAKLVSQRLKLGLTDRELVAMVTSNPGDALSRCWKKTIGRLTAGALGDVTVFRGNGDKPVWTQVVESTERDVMLVVFGGLPRYGDAALMTAAARTPIAPITVCGRERAFAIPNPAQQGVAWAFTEIKRALAAVRKDPRQALKKADGIRRAFAGALDAPEAPLTLVLDMPSGGIPLAGDFRDQADEIVIPPLPSLVHDDAFFNDVRRGKFHGGLLDGLAEFYK